MSQGHIQPTDDLRIRSVEELDPPAQVLAELPIDAGAAGVVAGARRRIVDILQGRDPRLLVVVGPCSIHDPVAALEYAGRLRDLAPRLARELFLVMRVYFEKPRTVVGWKGLINDPHLDASYRINEGLRIARRLLLDINRLGVPAGTEFLDLVTGQYHADLVAWGAIGARTTESQSHRELASGLSCPVGFKNATDGGVQVAIDAMRAAAHPHTFLSPTKAGRTAIFATAGNPDTHVILRGGRRPNYGPADVAATARAMAAAGLEPRIMVDLSHANSGRRPEGQLDAAGSVAGQLAAGERRIRGVMIESHLQGGRQDVVPGQPLAYGQSITDACLGWEQTAGLLERLAAAVRAGRSADVDSERNATMPAGG